MKIECDKCGAKYSIADDKVRGKTFKIRCKKCSNVIIVREKEGGEADGGASEANDPAGDEGGWHLAIDGETVGPVPEQEVRDRFAAGEIDKDTSIWQEGFEDWLPLGEVETFADLVASSASSGFGAVAGAGAAVAAAAAADPFADGGGDDYGGRFSEPEPAPAAREPAKAAASKPAAAAASPKAEAHGATPRVSNLTGARNENSVLFSLDSLSAVAMGGRGGGGGGASAPAAAAPSGPSFSLAPASSAPAATTATGEGSGLIDIRAMSAMLGSGGDSGGGGAGGGGGGGGAESGFAETAIPSFGGGFGGLAAAPLSIGSPGGQDGAVVMPEPVKASNGPMYALIGLLAAGLIGVVAFVVTRPPPEPQKIVEKVIVAGAVDEGEEDAPRKKRKKRAAEEEEEEEEEEEVAADPAAEDTTTKKTTTKKTTKTTKTGTKDAGTETKTGDAPPATKKDPPKEEKEDIGVDCLLNPETCKKGSSGSGGSGSSKPPAESGLPEKLTADQIKAGTASAKSSAESKCKAQSKGGEKITVKISIEGSSGKVLSASADDSGPLGTCVAGEYKNATFPKFTAPQQGAQVTVRF
jgi:predicted Zn finger-like uncharacterized protein